MPKLRVEDRGGNPPSRAKGRIVVPLWPFLILACLAVIAGLWFLPPHRLPATADFHPRTEQHLVIRFGRHRFQPVPDAVHHQVVLKPSQVAAIGAYSGHELYAVNVGAGGGGGHGTGLYLRSGQDRYVPLKQVPGS